MENKSKRKCACCGYFTIIQDWDICPVCYWEQDSVQEENFLENRGANAISLLEARINYKKIGACEDDFIEYVRAPLPDEIG